MASPPNTQTRPDCTCGKALTLCLHLHGLGYEQVKQVCPVRFTVIRNASEAAKRVAKYPYLLLVAVRIAWPFQEFQRHDASLES